MKGTVKFFNEKKGFGFIAGEDGTEVFVHMSSLEEGVTLHDNDAVTYDVEQGDRGPKAVHVKKDQLNVFFNLQELKTLGKFFIFSGLQMLAELKEQYEIS